MKNRLFQSVFYGLILAILISIPLAIKRLSSTFVFEVTMQSSARGLTQVYYDLGKGFTEEYSLRDQIVSVEVPITYHFVLPKGKYHSFRFDPINCESTITFSNIRILNPTGRLVREIPAAKFKPVQQISSWEPNSDNVRLTVPAGANDPILLLSFDAPLSLKESKHQVYADVELIFLKIFIICTILLWIAIWLFRRFEIQIKTIWNNFIVWINTHPKTAIIGMAIFAAILSTYPVVFFGKSFVSPNHGIHLLYQNNPTLPGYNDTKLENSMGSDMGAIMWSHLPYSVVQSHAIFHHNELPLWNRYSMCGNTLLGQGQSMFIEPLHIITLLAGGASWSWDIKYVLAKILFTLGMGLLVFIATRHLLSALILAFSSAFICFFAYRFNHPAFFSLCYAPWILYCWFIITQSQTIKTTVFGIAGLLLTNWAVLNSGTVKEAYMLIVCLNLSGILVLLLSDEVKQLKLTKWLMVSIAGILFVLISTPIWLTFLDALHKSYTPYMDIPAASQTQPNLFIGLFDDLFYRQLLNDEIHYRPGINFLVLLGFLYSLVGFKGLVFNRSYLAIAFSALIPLSLVFGIVPARIIVKIPFIKNIILINNVFSVALIIPLIVLAGFGLKSCWEQFSQKQWKIDYISMVLMLFALLSLYFGTTQTVHKSKFFDRYAFSLICAMLSLPLIARYIYIRKKAHLGIILLLLASIILLHWRHGMYLDMWFNKYVMNPQLRVNLQPKSPAIEFIKSDSSQPYRTVGFGANLFDGYNVGLLIESIDGCDPLMNKYHRELTKSIPLEWDWNWVILLREKDLAEWKPTYDFFNIKYYLASRTDNPKEIPGLRFVGKYDLSVYYSDSVWPRAFFTDVISPYQKPQEFVSMMQGGDGQPFAAVQTDVLDKLSILKGFLGEQKQRKTVSASDYRLTNNTTSFKIVAPSRGVIVLTESYMADDFRVTLNGKPADYFRVNHAFKGVPVNEAGTYEVSFSYWPKHFTLSLWASVIGLVLLIIWLGYWLYKRVPQEQPFVDKTLN